MINLLISPIGFCILSKTDDMIDVSEKMSDEMDLYNKFVDILGMDELISDEYCHTPSEIYRLIIEKVYRSPEKDHGFTDKREKFVFDETVKFNLLCAFNHVFIDVCQQKLGSEIKVDYV